jgi:hypothetical protein
MTRVLKRLSLGAASTLALVGVALAQQVGVNAAVKNEVTIRGEAEEAARDAIVGEEVRLRDLITSGDEAALQVLLLDETVFTVGPQAQLVVERFIYDPDRGNGEMAASVARGAFRYMSGRTARRSRNVQIDTPVASMGVRGTIIEGAVGRDAIEQLTGLENQFGDVPTSENATVIVLRGPGEGNQSLNRDGAVDITTASGTYTLTESNQALFITGVGNTVIGPFTLPQQTAGTFQRVLGTTPNGPATSPVPEFVPPPPIVLDEEPVDPEIEPEDEQVVDRPTFVCPVADGIPVTDGGLILDNNPGQTFDDFGGIDFGLDCID